jgi:hypothetical protein
MWYRQSIRGKEEMSPKSQSPNSSFNFKKILDLNPCSSSHPRLPPLLPLLSCDPLLAILDRSLRLVFGSLAG